MGGELPPGWDWAKLHDLGEIISGGTPKTSDLASFDGDIPWITPADLTGYKAKRISTGRRNISDKGLRTSSARMLPTRSVLFSSRAPIGYVAIAANPLATNQGFKSVAVDGQIDESFVYHYLKTAKPLAESEASGTTFKEISGSKFAQLPIPIPPLNEQRRIVEKIETLFAELDKGEEAIRAVQALLKRYRQSVLKAAVTGALTADWRAEHAGKLEHGRDLLARILDTRRAQWAGRGKYKEPVAPDTTGLPQLPEGWVWASLDSLVFDGPTNGISPTESKIDEGTQSFKLTATTSGEFIINADTIKKVAFKPEPFSKYWLKAGDVLVQRGNTIEYVGTAAIFPGPDNQFIFPDLMMRLRFADPALAAWAVVWINFEYAKKHFRRLATGTAGNMPKINSATLKSLAVPIPGNGEMMEVLSLINEISSKSTPMKKAGEDALRRSAALRQSILKQAFAGKLVPQDPADEPASELLARIRAGRADKPNVKRRRVGRS